MSLVVPPLFTQLLQSEELIRRVDGPSRTRRFLPAWFACPNYPFGNANRQLSSRALGSDHLEDGAFIFG